MDTALRAAIADDEEFALRVERQTMESYAIATWGLWNEAESRQRAIDNLRAGQTQVIELDGRPIGILRVQRTDSSIDLKQIFLLPEYQGRGLGSGLLHGLMNEAESRRLPLRLRVLKVNPALRLYERLGFSVVRMSPEHVYMEYAL